LARVNALSGGTSLEANIALIRNNAELAAQVAVELARSEANASRSDGPGSAGF
jgi:pseudouridine-5'-phosphate glycosidase